MVEKSYLLKSQPKFFVNSHTEWREPSDFSTGISGFSCNKYVLSLSKTVVS